MNAFSVRLDLSCFFSRPIATETIFRNLAFSLCASVFASSCGPVYDTTYRFEAPPHNRGGACIDGCSDTRDSCIEHNRELQSLCEERQQARIDECVRRLEAEKHRGPKITECGKSESCIRGDEPCENLYRSCYRACGGTVTEERVCVAFCP